MRRLLAVAILVAAVLVALVAWPLVAVAARLKHTTDRLMGRSPPTPLWAGPSLDDDTVARAVVQAHERDLRLGLARVH